MKVNSIKRKTITQKIAEALTDRKILHFRYDAHLRKLVYKQLNGLQKQLLQQISTVGVESIKKAQLNRLLSDLKQIIHQTYSEISQEQAVELDRFFMVETQGLTELYNKAIKYDLFAPLPAYKLKAMKNTPLIAGTPLEDWWAKQANDYRFHFEGLVRGGILEGKDTSRIITEVKELAQTQRRHAETLVITSVAKVADNAHKALRDENEDLINGEEHLSTLDLRTSSVCQVRDGLRWDKDKNPIGHNLPYQRPPLHPRCRSILQLWLKSWKELGIDIEEEQDNGTRASMDGEVKGSLHYEDWLKSKTPAEQGEVLGKGKADLWRRGVISFRDMLDQSGRPITLVELQTQYQPNFILPEVDTKALKGARFTQRQLQRKYKHASEDFNLPSNGNVKNFKLWQNAIVAHMNDENTKQFGVYRNSTEENQKLVYYNFVTGIAAVFDGKNQFETAFIPKDKQLEHYLKNEYLQ